MQGKEKLHLSSPTYMHTPCSYISEKQYKLDLSSLLLPNPHIILNLHAQPLFNHQGTNQIKLDITSFLSQHPYTLCWSFLDKTNKKQEKPDSKFFDNSAHFYHIHITQMKTFIKRSLQIEQFIRRQILAGSGLILSFLPI